MRCFRVILLSINSAGVQAVAKKTELSDTDSKEKTIGKIDDIRKLIDTFYKIFLIGIDIFAGL